ncbi:MAG TPA: tetratricopeptide repeat protein [Stellaceae bacterium]|nr:tetratricopeptide repeat protein [Stellaceae bacterium]
MRKMWLCLFVLLLAPASPSQADDSPEWTQCTGRPSAEITNDAMIAACTSVLDAAKEPLDRLATASFSRGLAYYRGGKRDQSAADYEAALRFNPKFAKVYLARGYEAVGDGKYAAAVREFDQAVKLDPKLVEAYYGRGLAYGADRQIDRSIKDHQKAIEVDPKYAPAHFGLGLEYRDKGQVDRAIASFNKAIELDPKYAQAFYNRGNAYGAKNQVDRAIEDYSAAIQIQPDYAKALFMRGLAYRDAGKTDQALADFDAAIRSDPKFDKAIEVRDETKRKIASTSPAPNGKEEETLFAFYLARSGNLACDFGVDDDEKAALEREVTARIAKAGISPERVKQLEMRADLTVAEQKAADAKFCASNGEFAGNAREMFDAVADRPKRSP